MSEHDETLADIVAKMRLVFNQSWHDIDREYVHDLPDRIEAAAKSEFATAEKSSAVGNSAAMREALIIARKAICHYAEHICQSLSWENSDLQSNCADVLCAHRVLCKAKTAINAALSAPARNCDLYKDAPSAYADFIVPWKLDGHMDDVPTLQDFADWLFAPAAERKGEDK